MPNTQVVLTWTREGKAGVEKLCHVPEDSRFVGAVTTVMFSGDKKYYPAKIDMIDDDETALEKRAEELSIELLKQKEKEESLKDRKKRVSRKPTGASDREISLALDGKAPVPPNLQAENLLELKAAKEAKSKKATGQEDLNNAVMATIKKTLFAGDKSKATESDSEQDDDDFGKEGSENEDENHSKTGMKWCNCKPCEVLKKYDTPMYRNVLKDIFNLFGAAEEDEEGQLFLELKEIDASVRKVELAKDSNVYIAYSDKEQLRLDFKNKPGPLAKETLFALYGRETFQMLSITGRGQKKGTYGIPSDVLQAICRFVNFNVDDKKKLTSSKLVLMINKRAKDWRAPTPSSSKKRTHQSRSRSSKMKGVSPLESTPQKDSDAKHAKDSASKGSPSKGSPSKASPAKRTPAKHSPAKCSPAKRSPAKRSPAKCSPAKRSPIKVPPAQPFNEQWSGNASYPYQSSHPQYSPSKWNYLTRAKEAASGAAATSASGGNWGNPYYNFGPQYGENSQEFSEWQKYYAQCNNWGQTQQNWIPNGPSHST